MEQKFIKNFPYKKVFWISVLIFCMTLLLLSVYLDVPFLLKMFFSLIIYPVIVLYSIGADLYESFSITKNKIGTLVAQLAIVNQEKDRLMEQLVTLKTSISYAKEIEMLELANHFYKDIHTVTVAQVMVKHCTESGHFFLINAGSSKGVKPDMVVVCNRMLIGRVVEVYPWYSKVILISDRQTKIAVFMGDETVTSIYQGENNEKQGGLIFVSNPDKLEHRELVISSGQGVIFPYGFVLGTVDKQKGELPKVTFFADMKHIRYCSVVTKNTDTIIL